MIWNVALFALLLVLHFPLYAAATTPSSLAWFGNLAQGIALFLAAIQFSRAMVLRDHPEALRFRILVVMGLWVCFMAHTLLAYSELLLGKPATATVTDLIWLAGYLLLLRALDLEFRGIFTKPILRQASIALLSAGIVFLALQPLLLEPDRHSITKAVQVVFPFLDLWISALGILIAWKSGKKRWLFAGFGFLIIGIADLFFPYHDSISAPVYRYLDIPLFVGYSMWWMFGAFLTVAPKEPQPQHRGK